MMVQKDQEVIIETLQIHLCYFDAHKEKQAFSSTHIFLGKKNKKKNKPQIILPSGDQGPAGPPGLRGPAGPPGDAGLPGKTNIKLLL